MFDGCEDNNGMLNLLCRSQEMGQGCIGERDKHVSNAFTVTLDSTVFNYGFLPQERPQHKVYYIWTCVLEDFCWGS